MDFKIILSVLALLLLVQAKSIPSPSPSVDPDQQFVFRTIVDTIFDIVFPWNWILRPAFFPIDDLYSTYHQSPESLPQPMKRIHQRSVNDSIDTDEVSKEEIVEYNLKLGWAQFALWLGCSKESVRKMVAQMIFGVEDGEEEFKDPCYYN